MLRSCHVDILCGLACISHWRRSGDFVCLNYCGTPPVVISHFGGTFKNASSGVVCSAALEGPEPRGRWLWSGFPSSSDLTKWVSTHWLILFFEGFSPPHPTPPGHLYSQDKLASYVTLLCVYSKHTVVLSKLAHKALSCFPDFTQTAGATVSETCLHSFIVVQSLKLTSDREKQGMKVKVASFWLSLLLLSRVKMSKAKFRGNHRQWCVHGPNRGHVNTHSFWQWPSFSCCNTSPIILSAAALRRITASSRRLVSSLLFLDCDQSLKVRTMNVTFHVCNPAEFSHSCENACNTVK